MKSAILLITLVTVVFQFARAAEEPKFFAAKGQYVLSPEITLVITDNAESRLAQYMLNYTSGGGSGQEITAAKPGDPFLIYWDRDTQTLWWATSVRIGYCDISKQLSARSSSHDRSKAFSDSDEFPPRPAVFITEVERTLHVQP